MTLTFFVLQAFGKFDLWLAAEHGMFLRHTRGEWKTTMPEHLNMDWMDSVRVSLDLV
jgi:trehalose 6-phosphate synthase/phosphatase